MGVITLNKPADPQPLKASGSDFVSDNGETKVVLTKDASTNANAVEVMSSVALPDGTTPCVKWYPRSLSYIDDKGLRDIIFNANNSTSVSVNRGVHARYGGHFPSVDDRFSVDAGQIKHFISINAEQRAPLAFLKNPRFSVVGVITIDPTSYIVAMGNPVTAKVEAIGSLDIKDANNITQFTLPPVEAWDQTGNKVSGTYIVTPIGSGAYEVAMCIPNAWLQQMALVYPVVIDPTIVNIGTTTASSRRHKIVDRTADGTIWALIQTSSSLWSLYRSTDGGNTWTVSLSNVINVNSAGQVFIFIDQDDNLWYGFVYTVSGSSYLYFYRRPRDTVNNGFGAVNASYNSGLAGQGDADFVAFRDPNVSGGYVVHMAIPTPSIVYYRFKVSATGSVTQDGNSYSIGGTTNYAMCAITFAHTGDGKTPQSNPDIFIAGAGIYGSSTTYPGTFFGKVAYSSEAWQTPAGTQISSTYGRWSIGPDPQYISVVYDPVNDEIYFGGVLSNGANANNFTFQVWKRDRANTTTTSLINSTNVGSSSGWGTYASGSMAGDGKGYFYISALYTPNGKNTTPDQIACWKYDKNGALQGTLSVLVSSIESTNPYVAMCPHLNSNTLDAIYYDGDSTNGYTYNYLQVAHFDVAPNAPTLTAHGNFDATIAQTLAWTFSDPDPGDTQSAYQLQIVDVASNTTVIDTGKVTSSAQTYSLAANALTNGKQYQWRITTWDSSGVQGAWSSYSTFYTAGAPTVAITAPANGSTVPTSSQTAVWTFSDPNGNTESTYRVQLYDQTSALVWDSGVLNGSATSLTIGYTLVNGVTYTLKVSATNSKGIASNVTSVSFSVSYTAPATPTATTTQDNTNARIKIVMTNPAPTGTQPTVTYQDLYRRNTGTSVWTRIATGLTPGSTFYDYAVASGQSYDYKVTSYGDNGTQVDSAIVSDVSIGQLRGLWIHDVNNPSGTCMNLKYMSNTNGDDGTTPNSVAWTPQATTMHFAGRALPTVQFGESYDFTLTKGKVVLFDSDGQWPTLESLIRVNKSILCFRDGRGRMIFGNVLSYDATDMNGGTQLDLVLIQVDYSIAV